MGITLNLKKCEFNKTRINFLGHQEGIHPDPQKIEAIQKMEAPTDVSSLRRFMGMVQQLGRFIPNLSDISHPLRELLSTRNAWVWGPDQGLAFSRIKEMLTKPATLSPYSIHAPTKVSADASARSRTPATAQFCVETSGIRIQNYVRYGTPVRANRKGSPGHDMGL